MDAAGHAAARADRSQRQAGNDSEAAMSDYETTRYQHHTRPGRADQKQ